ncbi:TIGR01621 family pseudouridine synthase [Motilimonas pumilua]|uniref:TIGR01621 family pseudouridine synthase n=1 Tax=Motilimonas pumila TaxID=2303987 RepID=A0A418YB62_9GAMM|nr:TIGR01621 family pseudouridine synthase [Motilimonas pumila]
MFTLVADEPDYLVVNKHAGVNFHVEDGEAGLVASVSETFGYPLFSVHRLDKMTSGLLVLAKSSLAAAQFTALFSERQVGKIYLALSQKKTKKKQGLIKGDMAKSRRGSYKLLTSCQQPALTQFKSHSLLPGMRLFILKPATGKTHQLRVALKSLGAPILGDERYGGGDSDRGYLHAYELSFSWQGQIKHYSCLPTSGQFFQPGLLQQAIVALHEQSLLLLNWPSLNSPRN